MKGYQYFLAIILSIFISAFAGKFIKTIEVRYASEYIESRHYPTYAMTDKGLVEYDAALTDTTFIDHYYDRYHYIGQGVVFKTMPPVCLYKKNTMEWMIANHLLSAK